MLRFWIIVTTRFIPLNYFWHLTLKLRLFLFLLTCYIECVLFWSVLIHCNNPIGIFMISIKWIMRIICSHIRVIFIIYLSLVLYLWNILSCSIQYTICHIMLPSCLLMVDFYFDSLQWLYLPLAFNRATIYVPNTVSTYCTVCVFTRSDEI